MDCTFGLSGMVASGRRLKTHQSRAVIGIVTGTEMAAIKANIDHRLNR